jgi:hypothetical protein
MRARFRTGTIFTTRSGNSNDRRQQPSNTCIDDSCDLPILHVSICEIHLGGSFGRVLIITSVLGKALNSTIRHGADWLPVHEMSSQLQAAIHCSALHLTQHADHTLRDSKDEQRHHHFFLCTRVMLKVASTHKVIPTLRRYRKGSSFIVFNAMPPEQYVGRFQHS